MSQAATHIITDADTPPSATRLELDVLHQDILDAIVTGHKGAARPAYITTLGSGLWRDANDRPFYYDGTSDLPQANLVDAVAPAASATAAGEIGDYAVDSTYRYDCIATDTWVRVAVAGGY